MVLQKDEKFAHNPTERGYMILYRQGSTNHCPSCSRSNWIVGRVSAECAFCHTALPLEGKALGTQLDVAA